jgi:hypothetical protein
MGKLTIKTETGYVEPDKIYLIQDNEPIKVKQFYSNEMLLEDMALCNLEYITSRTIKNSTGYIATIEELLPYETDPAVIELYQREIRHTQNEISSLRVEQVIIKQYKNYYDSRRHYSRRVRRALEAYKKFEQFYRNIPEGETPVTIRINRGSSSRVSSVFFHNNPNVYWYDGFYYYMTYESYKQDTLDWLSGVYGGKGYFEATNMYSERDRMSKYISYSFETYRVQMQQLHYQQNLLDSRVQARKDWLTWWYATYPGDQVALESVVIPEGTDSFDFATWNSVGSEVSGPNLDAMMRLYFNITTIDEYDGSQSTEMMDALVAKVETINNLDSSFDEIAYDEANKTPSSGGGDTSSIFTEIDEKAVNLTNIKINTVIETEDIFELKIWQS